MKGCTLYKSSSSHHKTSKYCWKQFCKFYNFRNVNLWKLILTKEFIVTLQAAFLCYCDWHAPWIKDQESRSRRQFKETAKITYNITNHFALFAAKNRDPGESFFFKKQQNMLIKKSLGWSIIQPTHWKIKDSSMCLM